MGTNKMARGSNFNHRLAMIALLAAASIGLVGPAQADLQSGVTKYQAGDYKGALEEWRPLAEKNDPNALFNLGQSYRLGRGVPADAKIALDFYSRAAGLGHVAAQGNAGTLLYFSEAPLRDRAKAIEWWQKASANGDPRAQYMLGVLHFNGEELPKDWPRAYALTLLARDSGLQEASTAMAQMDRFLPDADKSAGTTLAATMHSTTTAATVAKVPMATGQAIAPQKSASTAASTVKTEALPPIGSVAVPSSKAETPAPAMARTNAAWRVQLGAFSNEAAASKEWSAMQSRNGSLRSEAPMYDTTATGVVRVRIGAFSARNAADSRCASLKAQGISCFVVKGDPVK
jgi:uncharacterized protein